jgi:carbohydrate diacid regulator
LHQGALKAINKNGVYKVTLETFTDKLGVNMPICYGGEIIGVIGISGNPRMVEPLVYVIKVIAELMIERQYMMDKKAAEHLSRENFLREWCDTPGELLSQAFKQKAVSLGVDLSLLRTAAMICIKKPKSSFIETLGNYLLPDEFVLRYRDEILVLLKDSPNTMKRLNDLLDTFPEIYGIGVGGVVPDLSESVVRANKCITLLKRENKEYFTRKKILSFEEYHIVEMVELYKNKEFFAEIMHNIENYSGGEELKKTFLYHFRLDGNIKAITSELHIHRNTYLYRMQKIEEATGLSFKDFNHFFNLYVSVLVEILSSNMKEI